MNQSLVAAIVYSTGKNGSLTATGADELANLNGDRVFVFHTPTPSTASSSSWACSPALTASRGDVDSAALDHGTSDQVPRACDGGFAG